MPPVARMSETPGWDISAWVSSRDGFSTQRTQYSGAPAASAAS